MWVCTEGTVGETRGNYIMFLSVCVSYPDQALAHIIKQGAHTCTS